MGCIRKQQTRWWESRHGNPEEVIFAVQDGGLAKRLPIVRKSQDFHAEDAGVCCIDTTFMSRMTLFRFGRRISGASLGVCGGMDPRAGHSDKIHAPESYIHTFAHPMKLWLRVVGGLTRRTEDGWFERPAGCANYPASRLRARSVIIKRLIYFIVRLQTASLEIRVTWK